MQKSETPVRLFLKYFLITNAVMGSAGFALGCFLYLALYILR